MRVFTRLLSLLPHFVSGDFLLSLLEENFDLEMDFGFDLTVWQEIKDSPYFYTFKKKNLLYLGYELLWNALV